MSLVACYLETVQWAQKKPIIPENCALFSDHVVTWSVVTGLEIGIPPVPGKVFTRVLLARINPLLKNHRRSQQTGFTAGRSTTNAILALRLLSELHREFDRAKWQDRVKNVDIADRTDLPNIADIISKRRQALFGHVVRLDATTPAHQKLCQVIAMKGGQSLGMNWRRPPGRPRKTWIQQIGNGTPAVSWRQMWQSADEREHRGESPQQTSAVYVS